MRGPTKKELPRNAPVLGSRGPDSFGRRPLVFPQAARDWPAIREANLSTLLTRFADTKVEARIDLPDDGVPYRHADADHRAEIALADLGARIARAVPCYAAQVAIGSLPGLETAFDFDALLGPGERLVSLWIGTLTKSGLHYDLTDNLFAQIDGIKHVILVDPNESRALYPFPDSPTKSRIDPEHPDLAKFPRLTRATFWTATLEPGDILFIPRGWWHFLSAPGPSVSVSCWYGPAMTAREQIMAVTKTNPLMWKTILLDFVRFGVFGRPYTRRLLSPPPAGKMLHELVTGRIPRQDDTP